MTQPASSYMLRADSSAGPLSSIPLLLILGLIFEDSNREALDEVHCRTLFRVGGRPPQRFIDFLGELRDSPAFHRLARFRPGILERAFDLTVDKFTLLPDPCVSLKHSGPDCRLYFRAVVDRFLADKATYARRGTVAEETAVAKLLQGQVTRHFGYSCLEARRESDEVRSRYAWYLKGSAIHLRFPMSVSGLDRRAWLEANVPDPDPNRANESQRVQEIVDRLLGVPGVISLGLEAGEVADEHACNSDLQWVLEHEITAVGLAALVADEKCRNLVSLRPAIRALGEQRLRQLILHAFEGLEQGALRDGELAREFGVSKATLSRFLGNRRPSDSHASIGDLWRNTAQVLASTPAFVEAARDAGVWSSVESILGDQAPERDR